MEREEKCPKCGAPVKTKISSGAYTFRDGYKGMIKKVCTKGCNLED